jgi:transposase
MSARPLESVFESTRANELQAAHRCQAALIAALQTLRGIGFLSAVTIAAETGDLRRFALARN